MSSRTPFIPPCVSSGGGKCCQPIDVSLNIGTIDVSVNIVDATIIADISGSVNVDISDVTVNVSDSFTPSSFDAFGRLRVSNPYTLYEFTSILGKGAPTQGQVIIDEDLSGSGTSTWSSESYINMDVSGTGYVIRQTHAYIPYQPGKSKLVYLTGVLYHDLSDNPLNTTTDLISRIGTFDASMGIFVECSGGTIAVVQRNGGVETRVPRASWVDKLDGTGSSGVTVNFAKAQIFVFDFEWLGVGQVRCGIVIGGQLYVYYTFTHINELDSPYIRTATLPLRYEIRGGPTTRNSLHMICGSVISEGGFNPLGNRYIYPVIDPFPSWQTLSPTNQTFIPLLSLRIRSDYPGRVGTIKLKNVDLFSGDPTKYGSWRIVLNADVSGGTWTDYDSNSSIAQVITHVAGHTYTANSGRVLYSNFYAGRANSTLATTTDELIAAPPIAYNQFTGRSDTITLIANSFTNNAQQLWAVIEWIEFV
jgi:hypothetical protein